LISFIVAMATDCCNVFVIDIWRLCNS
jgi:hypothetical protein